MYRSLIERTTLRVLDMTFRIAHPDLVDRIAFNGCVAGGDPATGRDTPSAWSAPPPCARTSSM